VIRCYVQFFDAVKCKNVNVKTIIVSKMTSLSAGTDQEKRESEIGIGKTEKMGFKTRVKGGERWSSGGVRWKTVPQRSGRDRKRSVADGRQPSA